METQQEKLIVDQVKAELREWWSAETATWDADSPTESTTDSDIWDGIPVLDSKAAARSSPVFERILGRPLDVKLIKPGGYDGIDEMADDLIKKMIAKNVQEPAA